MVNACSPDSLTAPYWHYLQRHCPDLDWQTIAPVLDSAVAIAPDHPKSAMDCNNLAILALIEAEQTENLTLRSQQIETAYQLLTQGLEQHPGHPLCLAHLAVLQCLVGETQSAIKNALFGLLTTLQPTYGDGELLPPGFVYSLPDPGKSRIARCGCLQHLIDTQDGNSQALLLFADVLYRSQLVFYNASGKRFLQMALTLAPDMADWHLKLGLAHIHSQVWDGLLNLHLAQAIAPSDASVIQALYLAYRQLEQWDTAQSWYQFARIEAESQPHSLEWYWATLPSDHPFTYIPLNGDLLLTVEPSLFSSVTIVVLAEGTWFEAEMEFWQHHLQPGMTVIDVGANVGVYTFSAAQRVGSTGRVLAVEPFSGCVRCLQETCRVNRLDWVTVCAGAASDRPGTIRLSLQESSELNEVLTDDTIATGSMEEVPCFTLDSLIEQEQLQRVDWIKIDAEGYEVLVLQGSDRLLTEFAPAILYENIAGNKGSNAPVAEYLQARHYQLFRYQPYLNQLLSVSSMQELEGNLNMIALPPEHPLRPN